MIKREVFKDSFPPVRQIATGPTQMYPLRKRGRAESSILARDSDTFLKNYYSIAIDVSVKCYDCYISKNITVCMLKVKVSLSLKD